MTENVVGSPTFGEAGFIVGLDSTQSVLAALAKTTSWTLSLRNPT